MNVLEKILEEMKKIKDGNRKEKLYGKYPPQNKRQETLNAYSQGYEDGTDNFYNAIIPIIRSHINGVPDMDNGWIPVSEKLPEEKGWYQCTCSDKEIWNDDIVIDLYYYPEIKEFVDNIRYETNGLKNIEKYFWTKYVTAWCPLPEPYKEV
ncbi:hypothetical protein HMPREF1216_01694 [Coprococcus sp. HPP0048]|nr:hypothetical protein HMPREF1216_01694 [Coprococcus sp. HPP0048]